MSSSIPNNRLFPMDLVHPSIRKSIIFTAFLEEQRTPPTVMLGFKSGNNVKIRKCIKMKAGGAAKRLKSWQLALGLKQMIKRDD